MGLLPRLAFAAEPGRSDASMKDDWPWIGRYSAEDERLRADKSKVQIVFLGDSITEGWQKASPQMFGPGWINRGISGQTSPQMVLRMVPDVVSLRPRLVHILAGTNDVAQNTGPMTSAMTLDNISAMVAIAHAARITVLLGAIPPAASFYWNAAARPAQQIIECNTLLRQYARAQKLEFVDYHAALADAAGGGIDPRNSDDAVHPNARGYDLMARLLAPIVKRNLRHLC